LKKRAHITLKLSEMDSTAKMAFIYNFVGWANTILEIFVQIFPKKVQKSAHFQRKSSKYMIFWWLFAQKMLLWPNGWSKLAQTPPKCRPNVCFKFLEFQHHIFLHWGVWTFFTRGQMGSLRLFWKKRGNFLIFFRKSAWDFQKIISFRSKLVRNFLKPMRGNVQFWSVNIERWYAYVLLLCKSC